MPRIWLILAVAVSLWRNASAADRFTAPKGWRVVPAPDADRLECAHHSFAVWAVSLRNGSASISLDPGWAELQAGLFPDGAFPAPGDALPSDDPLPRDDVLPPGLVGSPSLPTGYLHVLPVDGGSLVGGDAGEFGGGLTWFSADGKVSQKLHGDAVVALVSLGRDAALSFEGVNHLGLNSGTARWLKRHDETFSASLQRVFRAFWRWPQREDRTFWRTVRTADLEEAPGAVLAEGRQAYLVGHHFLTIVSYDGGVKQLQRLPMSAPNASSIVRDANGALWIGARHFVLRLVPQQDPAQPFAVTWLVPAGCRTTVNNPELGFFWCACAE